MISPVAATQSFDLALFDLGIGNDYRALGPQNFFVAFYVETHVLDELISVHKMSLLRISEGRYIVSGSLRDWQLLLRSGLSKESSTDLRKLLGLFYVYLRDNGFNYLFSDYRRENMYDNTFIFK